MGTPSDSIQLSSGNDRHPYTRRRSFGGGDCVGEVWRASRIAGPTDYRGVCGDWIRHRCERVFYWGMDCGDSREEVMAGKDWDIWTGFILFRICLLCRSYTCSRIPLQWITCFEVIASLRRRSTISPLLPNTLTPSVPSVRVIFGRADRWCGAGVNDYGSVSVLYRQTPQSDFGLWK